MEPDEQTVIQKPPPCSFSPRIRIWNLFGEQRSGTCRNPRFKHGTTKILFPKLIQIYFPIHLFRNFWRSQMIGNDCIETSRTAVESSTSGSFNNDFKNRQCFVLRFNCCSKIQLAAFLNKPKTTNLSLFPNSKFQQDFDEKPIISPCVFTNSAV